MHQHNENYHLGYLLFDGLRRKLDNINQIDASTGEMETNASLLSRSIRLAKCLKKYGLVPGDVLVLSAKNHLDTRMVHYAGLFEGLSVAAVDPLFKCEEIKSAFKICEPKLAFCQPETYDEFVQAIRELGHNVRIITFGKGDNSIIKFMENYDDVTHYEYSPAVYDCERVSPWLVPTSGTTGGCKMAAYKCSMVVKFISELAKQFENTPIQNALNLSPVQWISGFSIAVWLPLFNIVTVQTSAAITPDHLTHVINTYKPVSLLTSPPIMMMFLNQCPDADLSCFKSVTITGGKVHIHLLEKLQERVGNKAAACIGYGQTETCGPALTTAPLGPLGNCGIEMQDLSYKLVNPETGEVITKQNVTGELWVTGRIFSHYHNNPEQTAEAFSGEWYKTGDLMYRDENGYYFYIDRLKMLIKYRNIHVIPTELEAVILELDAVADVVVTSIPHPEDGEHPVACVVRVDGSNISAQDIKDYVAEKLSVNKHLRGGVVFVDNIPYLPSGKAARLKVRQLIATLSRE